MTDQTEPIRRDTIGDPIPARTLNQLTLGDWIYIALRALVAFILVWGLPLCFAAQMFVAILREAFLGPKY